MEHVVTTYGGGELFSLVFNGIAALFKQDATGMVMPLIRVGLMVGLVYTVILMFIRSSVMEGLHWLFWVILATNLLFLPKTTVFIHDPLTKERFKVDHVPLALGSFASFVSYTGKILTEKMETVFTLPDYMPYHQTGTVFASSLMSQVGKFRIVDPLFKGNMERFVNQCVVYDVMIGRKYTLQDLQHTPDIWQLVKAKASPVLGFMYQSVDSPGKIVTCKEGAQALDKLWTAEIKRATALYGSRVQNRTLTESAFTTGLLGSAKLLVGSKHMADSAMDLLRQEMMIQAIEESSNNKLSELGSPSNYAATKALLQQRSTYEIAGDIAARTLPLFKNVIEALSYALFIFIVVLALLPNGYRILITYFGILVWTQLWAPLYAVLNLIMTLYGRSETSSLIQEGLTLLNSSAILNANADMVTLAAWLAVSIPFISYGILKQGASAFVGLAHHLGSAMQASASGVASESVSGNISLGNVSLGTQAYQNTTAFQHHTSPSYNASQFKALLASGVEQSTFGEGTQTVQDHTIPNLPLKLMASINTSHEHQQRLQEAQSLAQSKSMAAGQSMESALQQTSNVLSRLGSDISKHENYSNILTTNESKVLQDHTNFTKDISESLGVSQARAHDIALAVKAGSPEWLGVSAGVSTTASSSRAHQEHYQKAQSLAQQKGYSYSLDSVLSASQSIMESTHDTQGAELATGAQASLNQASHLREEASLAHTRVKEASRAFASSQRKDFQETRDITHPFLEYVAGQPVNKGPEQSSSPMGMMRATAILKAGGDEYQTYLEGFKKDHPQYEIQRVPVAEAQGSLENQYTAHSTAFKGTSPSLESQHSQNKESIDQKGKELGLMPERVEDSPIKTDVQQKHTETDIRIKERQEGVADNQSSLEKKVDTVRDENVVWGNAKQIGNSTWEAAGDIYKALTPNDSAKVESHPVSNSSASLASPNPKPTPPSPSSRMSPQDPTKKGKNDESNSTIEKSKTQISP